jgi:hypothetical protein
MWCRDDGTMGAVPKVPKKELRLRKRSMYERFCDCNFQSPILNAILSNIISMLIILLLLSTIFGVFCSWWFGNTEQL